jgi:hypothetical protein
MTRLVSNFTNPGQSPYDAQSWCAGVTAVAGQRQFDAQESRACGGSLNEEPAPQRPRPWKPCATWDYRERGTPK